MFFPYGVLLGLVLAWRFEKTGGFVAALSMVLFYVIHQVESGGLPRGPWFFLIAAPGLLFICCGNSRAKPTKSTTAESLPAGDAGSAFGEFPGLFCRRRLREDVRRWAASLRRNRARNALVR